jgi:hypothetical protein
MTFIQPITSASSGSAFVPTSRTLSINGVAYDLTADRSWTVSGLTGLIATAPLSFNSGTSTLSISQATNTTDGFLSSADWLTFSSKQPFITLTTTGNSGASTIVGATLNIPEYTLAGLGGFTNPMTSLGDIIYGNAVGLAIRRAGNITTTKMYLSQTGDGTNSAAPQWSAIAVGEVSGAVSALTGEVSTTGTGTLNVTLGTNAVTGKLLTGLSITSGAITSSDSILSAFGKVQGQINGLAGGSTYKGSWNANTNTPTITSGTGTNGDYYIVAVAGSTTIDGISSWDVGDWIIFNGSVWQKIDNTDSVISVNGQVGSVVLTTANISENTNLYYTDARARAAISLTTTGASGAATYTSGVLNIPNYTIAGLGGISGSGTTNYLPKFTSATSIGDSIIAESSGLATIYGNGQVYKGQSGSGQSSLFITNDDNSFGNRHETKISTQAYGGGLGRTIIQAASYNTSTNRGELAILTESGANFVANIGTLITGSDNAFSLYNTIFTENIRLNTGGDSFLMGGNVGIGITSPNHKLHILSTIKTLITDFGSGVNVDYVGSTANRFQTIGFSWSSSIGNASTLWGMGFRGNNFTSGTGDVFLYTQGVQGLTVTQNGQIQFNLYTSSSSFSGTIAGLLAFDSSGNVITTNLAGVGGVPTSRTITINGTTQDLSTDRTYSVGTVTSVSLSVPTGLSVAGTPITSSGTLAISLTAGYSIPTTLSQSNWDLAYNDKINSVSVTGTTTKTLTLTQQDGGTITASWTDINTDAVTSVFGRTGAVVATSGDYNTLQVTENTNLYYTEARVNANANVAANTAARHNAVTLGTANGLTLSTQQLSLGLASGSTNGALSSTDWTTFNNKQNTLTNPITGTGTTNYIAKFSGSTTLTNSLISEGVNFVNIGENGSASEYSLQIGNGRSGNGFAYIDLIGDTTYSDYGIRLIRGNSGANSTSTIEHRGTGDFIFKGVDASTIKFQTGSTDRMIVDSAGRVGIGVSPTESLQVSGNTIITGNLAVDTNTLFVNATNNRVGIGTAVPLDTVHIDGELRVTSSYSIPVLVTANRNILINTGAWGVSAVANLVMGNGTAPTSSPSDMFHMYSNDITAGNAAPHFRTENGAIIKIYQETTSVGNAIFSAGGGSSVLDDSTFDGYTIRQLVKALRNQGILA